MSAPSPEELLHASFGGLDPMTRDEVSHYLLGGRNHRFPAKMKPAVAAAIGAIENKARADFYLAMDRADDQLLIRLGRLLAVTPAVRFFFIPAHVPASIWALLDDAFRAVFGSGGQAPTFSTMTARRVQRLLELEGVRPDASAGLVIDMLVGTNRGSLEYAARGLQTIPGTAELMAAHRDVLYERVSSYENGGHIEVIRQAAGHPVLAVRIAELLAAYAVWSDKDIRTSALAVFATLPVDMQVLLLESRLVAATGAERSRVIAAVERIPDTAAAVGVLERALADAKGAVADELDRAIQRLAIFGLSDASTEAPAPMVPLPEHRLDEVAVESIRTALTEFAERRRRSLPALERARDQFLREHPGAHPGNEFEHVLGLIQGAVATMAALPTVAAYLSGEAPYPGEPLMSMLLWQGVRERIVGFEPVNWARASARPGLSRVHRWRIVGQEGVADARAIADVLIRSGCSPEEAHNAIVDSYFADAWSVPLLTPAQLAPYLVDNPHVFDVVLGLANGVPPRGYGDFTDAVLAVLEASPSIAARYLPVVTALAIGSAKTHRRAAQRVLETHGLARRLAEEALRASGVQERTAAVLWLEALGGEDTITLLGAHLEREKATAVRATVIAALERLGRDIREYLRPEVLEAEAVKAKGVPAGLRWFPFAELPECRYADGSAVPALVIRSWVALAFSLKDPVGAGLVPLYLRTLDERDAEALGRFVLMTWLARDSAPLDDETVMRRSMAAVVRYEASIAELVRWIPDLEVTVGQTLDFFDAEREKLQATPPSAIGDKGLLALATRMNGMELAEIVRQFMRRQHLKRAQIDALLHVIAQSGHPEPLHLLVATARRYRTAGLQETARMLVEQVAARRGWTADELADRMIPTVGLDADRSLTFDYGPRQFVGRVGTQLVIELLDDDGLPVRALPAPRVGDTEAIAAKAAFSAAKKELAAVVKLQRRRLYDAMCLRREWTALDWRSLIVAHPIAGLLASGLVWHLGDEVGRPEPDGRILDAEGVELVVPDSTIVTVAHSTTLRADVIAGWRSRPAPVALGFDQFRARPVAVTGTESQSDDLEGVESESFTLRSRLTKLEWTRGETGDDVRFDEYVKAFGDLVAVISFSGSSLPETSIPIELGVLTVRRDEAPERFSNVPAALLAELVADYRSLD